MTAVADSLRSNSPWQRDALGPDLGKELAAKQFVINHYAEKVVYTADGWLEKNRGQLKKCAACGQTRDGPVADKRAPRRRPARST